MSDELKLSYFTYVILHKGAGNSRATVRTDTQYDVIAIDREIARNQHSELVIQGTDGRIRAKDSYGNDPFPPKG